MPHLHAEVACQSATACELAPCRPRALDALPISGEAHGGVLVPMRLDDDRAACEIRDLEFGIGEDLSKGRCCSCDEPGSFVIGEKIAEVAAQNRGATG